MKIVTIRAAEKALSQLLARVETGEETVPTRGKKPIAKLVPYRPRVPERRFGAFAGIVDLGLEFFEPLPAEELEAWEQ